ncbi:MAG TPA: ABC transporter permease [Gemmatimonadaceae bacterium]
MLSLALGIALNTTMYSVLDAVMNPHPDVRHGRQVYAITYSGPGSQRRLPPGAVQTALRADPDFDALSDVAPVSFGAGGTMVQHGAHLRDAAMSIVGSRFFEMLGVHPQRGRLFVAGDSGATSAPVVLNARLADELFPGGEPAIGKLVDVEGMPRLVIGVVPGDALRGTFFGDADLWSLPGTARVAPITTIVRSSNAAPDDIGTHLRLIAARLDLAAGKPVGTTAFWVHDFMVQQFAFKGFHYALIGAVLAVLLVACSNLANLQLARGIARGRELALRSALGASRRDLVVHLMVESAVLAAVGLAVGLVFTYWGIHAISALVPLSVAEYIIAPHANWRVLVFAVVVAVLCLVQIGLLPAIRVSRVDPNDLIKGGAGTGAHRRNRQRYGVLVVVEIALSLAVLSGAALIVRSAWRIQRVDYGFDPSPVARALVRGSDTAGVIPSAPLAAEIVQRLRAAPEVADAAVSFDALPEHGSITVDDASGASRQVPAPLWSYAVVSPSIFRTMGLRIVAGRDFDDAERDADLVIVDQTTARALWPNANPIGRMIKLGDWNSARPWVRVIGVVPDVKGTYEFYNYLRSLPSGYRIGKVYRVLTMRDSIRPTRSGYRVNVLARATGDPARLLLTLRQRIRSARGVRVVATESMLDFLGVSTEHARRAFIGALFAVFAAIAVGLSALGVFGIVAHSVAERRREFGVRIALGAGSRHILRGVLGEGNVIALAGIALGLLLTKYDVTWLRAFYRDEEQYDATLFATMAAALFVVTMLAALLPAMRATRVDPVESLKHE